jgi:Ca2+-binding EF-hand superfamily protein
MSKAWTLLPLLACAGTALADPPPVQRAAVEQRATRMFDRCDANHDGVLTLAEYHAALAAIVKAKGGTPTPKGWAIVDAQFATVDQSHSGRVTRQQFVDAAVAHFDGADLNHDGTVTPKEARAAAKIKNREAKRAKVTG